LPNKEMIFYYFPDDCEFKGIDDRTPPDHDPLISVNIVKRPNKDEWYGE